jgi:Haemolymph juvenile hormone binding protein (JHBP)
MMKCEKFERDGEEFLNITRFAMKMEPKSASIYLGNLFGGDEALGWFAKLIKSNREYNIKYSVLGKAMNQIINQNSRDIIRELSPAIASTFGSLFRDISNKIFHKVPFNTIFLQ